MSFEAMQLRGVPKVATLSLMGHGFGLRRAQFLTLNPKPFHIYRSPRLSMWGCFPTIARRSGARSLPSAGSKARVRPPGPLGPQGFDGACTETVHARSLSLSLQGLGTGQRPRAEKPTQ